MKAYRSVIAVLILAALFIPQATPAQSAPRSAESTISLQPGDKATINCPTKLIRTSDSRTTWELVCRVLAETFTPTAGATAASTQTSESTATQMSESTATQTSESTATQTSEPIPTHTHMSEPTATQILLPTATGTLLPTVTWTPTATATRAAGGLIQPFNGAPACPTHDPRKWHALWDYQRGCYYNHEHGDDPALANTIFGAAGEWWNGGNGANIGVPWETSAIENQMKHPMSKYYVRVQGGYQPFPNCGTRAGTDNSSNGANNNCIKAVRLLAHGSSNPMEALARNHSMAIEVYITSKASNYANGGILRMGSWLDYGKLQAGFYSTQHARPGGSVTFPDGMTMNFAADTPEVFGDLGGEPYWFMTLNTANSRYTTSQYPDSAGEQWSSNEVGPYTAFDCAPFPTGSQCGDRHVHILTRSFDSFALLNPAPNVNSPYYVCPQLAPANCTYNGATRSLKETAIWIDPAWDSLDGATDGSVTYNGYTDRWQRMRPAGQCSAIGLDCIPIMMQNVPVGYAASSHNPGTFESDVTDYDVCAKAGFWCISFPN